MSTYNNSPLIGGLDDCVDINDDEAYTLATEIWEDINRSGLDDGSSILSFVEYLKIIQTRAKGFSFAMPEGDSKDNSTKKTLLGVL